MIPTMLGRAVLPGVMLLLAGCVPQHRREMVETRSVDPQGAETVRAQIDMGAGGLRVSGGAAKLLEARFEYNVPQWRPELRYDVSRGASRGYLTLRQPGPHAIGIGHTRYDWDLRFSDKVPIDLRINLGAGESVLRLGGLALTALDVNIGAGRLDLDLDGPWSKDLLAHISGGVGTAVVRLPGGVGVRVHARGGLGGIHASRLRETHGYYVNDAYGRSDVTLRVDVSGGIGTIELIGG